MAIFRSAVKSSFIFYFFCLNRHGQQTTFCPSRQPNQQKLRKDYQEACLKRASADDPCNLLRLQDLRNPVTKQDFVCLLRTRLFVCPFVCCFNWIWCFRGSLQRISSKEKTFFFFLFCFLSFLFLLGCFALLCASEPVHRIENVQGCRITLTRHTHSPIMREFSKVSFDYFIEIISLFSLLNTTDLL